MSKACSLFSGSSGNSIYVGCGDNQILVDIGVSARRCEQKLRQVGAVSYTHLTLPTILLV